jgi:hypothetical protein
MSRRHHGGRPHRPSGHVRQPSTPLTAAPDAPGARPEQPPSPRAEPIALASEIPAVGSDADRQSPASAPPDHSTAEHESISTNGAPNHASINASPSPIGPLGPPPGCTAPQLRRFIKSRPYVPMHELRRRFGINGTEDDVTPVDLADGRIYIGLPPREGSLLGELLRGGEVGYELSLDPRSPIVVGLYPMRPVPRS